MDWGKLFTLMTCPNVIKLFSKQMDSSLVLRGGRYRLATKWEVLFANTFTQTDSESFSSSVIGICKMSLWTSNMTPPTWLFLSFLYTLYEQVSGNGKSSEVAIQLSIFNSWISKIYSAMNEHSLWFHISQLSHWTAVCHLGQCHCKDHSQLYSLKNTKLRHQIQFLRGRRHQVLSMERGSVFRIHHIQGVYPTPYSTFCISHIETWDLGSFRYPQPGRQEWTNLFPLRVWSYIVPQYYDFKVS